MRAYFIPLITVGLLALQPSADAGTLSENASALRKQGGEVLVDEISTQLVSPGKYTPEDYEKGVTALANHYERSDKMSLAIKVLLEGIRLLPGDPESASFLGARNRLRMAAGNWYNRIGEHHTAQRHYNDALDDAKAAGLDTAVRLTYFNMGSNLIDLHQYASSINVLRKAHQHDGNTMDSISWRSMAMIAYAHFSVHEYTSAKEVALLAWEYGINAGIQEHPFMEYYATIIAVGEAIDGNLMEANAWDSRIVTRTPALINDPRHLNVRIVRLEQQGDPLNTVTGYATLYERFHRDFLTRMNETHLKDLMAYETQRFESEAAAVQAKAEMNEKLIQQNTYYHSYLIATIAGALFTGASLCVMIMKETRVHRALRRLALEDPLTHSPNRRAITRYAARCLNEANRTSPNGLGIAVIDLDNFKRINDSYGHAVGDAVLSHFYTIASSQLRQSDMLGRYGGEEFLMVMPNLNEPDIRCLFERLQQSLKDNPYQDSNTGDEITVTVSMGATRYLPSPLKNKRTPTLESLVSMADSHVYMAKSQGRDQIVIA